jgi:hypothetical protein
MISISLEAGANFFGGGVKISLHYFNEHIVIFQCKLDFVSLSAFHNNFFFFGIPLKQKVFFFFSFCNVSYAFYLFRLDNFSCFIDLVIENE